MLTLSWYDNWLLPPEPLMEGDGKAYCPDCEMDTDSYMVQWQRAMIEAQCLCCGHDHELELDE